MSELLGLGISHRTAPLELRERLALTEGRASGILRELVDSPDVVEAAALSTCNRTEIYLVAADPVKAESLALGLLAREADLRPTELLGHLYSDRAVEAAAHLFRVTAGLDSMILGEAEIQGQVKRAYELALVEGATGPVLNRLFRGDDYNWRVEAELGGPSRAFADIGSHWCDLVEFVSGQRITALVARTTIAHGRRAPVLEPLLRARRRRRRGAAASTPRTPPSSSSRPTPAPPARSSSRRSRPGARTGSASRSRPTPRPSPSTRNSPARWRSCGARGRKRCRATSTPSRPRRPPT